MSETSQEKTIFYAALEVSDPADRLRLVKRLCAGDNSLRQQVDALLGAHEETGQLTSPVDEAELGTPLPGVGPGQTIGRYKLLENIGEGGFGVVFMAEQVEPIRRRVALKVIKAGMDTKQVIGRFEAERQALALMDHPNIAKVIDAGATDTGRPFFVMELVRGIPITTFCDDHTLTTEQRLRIFIDVCSAIQHAHQKGIIHRDIKPSNILVADDGERHVAKVIDFGVAKATQGRLTDKTLFTQFRQLIGTPAYMSPEQAQMTAVDVDTRSDVYSLGVLLYELITGMTPFDSTGLVEAGFEEMCRKIREIEPLTPSTRLSSLSNDEKTTAAKFRRIQHSELEQTVRGELDWIVMKAMEKSRTRRYESAGAFKHDVHRFLANEPVSAAAPSTTYLASKFVSKNRKLILSASAFAVLLLLGTVISVALAIRANGQTKRALAAEQTAKKSERIVRRNQYAAEMLLAQGSLNALNSENIYELLKKQIPKPGEPDYRGFEWRRLWNNTYRRQLFSLEGHTDEIRSVAMSPDGRWLASGSVDGTARLWDLGTRRVVWSTSKGDDCNHVEFSADGRRLVTRFWNGDPLPSRWILWDLADPKNPTELRDLNEFSALSPDGKTAIGGSSTIKQFSLETEEVLRTYVDPAFADTEFAGQSHQSGLWSLSFSMDGQRLLTVGKDKTVKLWSTDDGSVKKQFSFEAEVFDASFSPVDETIATVTLDSGVIQIWDGQADAVDTKTLRQIEINSPLDGVRFSMDGKKLVVSERFGRIHVFDTQTWDELGSFDSRGSMEVLRFCSPVDPNVIVTASESSRTNSIRFWDISAREPVLNHESPVRDLQFSHDGAVLAVGMVNGAVQFWDVGDCSEIFATPPTRTVDANMRERLGMTTYKPGFVQISPDNERVAVVGPKDVISVWNIKQRRQVKTISVPGGKFWSLIFSPTGEQLYAASRGKVYVWDVNDPEQPTAELKWEVYCFAWAPDGLILASGNTDVRLRNPPNDQVVRTLDMSILPSSYDGISCLDFSPTGTWLAGGTSMGNVWLWDTSTWTHETLPIATLGMSVSFSHSSRESSLPDRHRLVAGDLYAITKMWDVESRQTVATFDGAIAEFSPDGTHLAVGCEAHLASLDMPATGRVRLYYAPPLEELVVESSSPDSNSGD